MPTKKKGKTDIKPPSHVQDSLMKKASEVNDTTKLLDETKQTFHKFKFDKIGTEVKNKKTQETTDTENATIETKKTKVDASWSDFPEAHKLLKLANQKRSNNDLRGAIDVYIQVYNNLEQVGKIPTKRLTLKIISKIACAHMDLEEYEEASRALENASWIQISLADLLYNEAKIAVDRNEIGRAETLISEAMNLWENKQANQSEDSLNKYVQILELGSKVLLSAKKFKKSVEAYNKIIEYSSQLDTSYLTKRRENYINFTELMSDDLDLIRTVTEENDLADIVVDCSMSKTFCFYKGKNCYKNLDLALKLSLNNASLQTNSFRIFIHSGIYEWPQKTTLQAFLSNFEATSKQKSILRVTGASKVIFFPNASDPGDFIEIVEFSSGEIYFKNVFFGDASFHLSVSGFLVSGFLVPKPLRKLTLYFERKTNVYFESCRFSNTKIESRTTLSKSDRSSLKFDFCHFENDDSANFEFSCAPWWKISLSNCAIKQHNDTTGVVAKVSCCLTFSNTDIYLDSYKTGNKLIVIGDNAKFTATGCCFGSKNSSRSINLVGMKEEVLPLSKNNTMKLWDGQAIAEPWNIIHHKPHDLLVLNGATCCIEKSYLFWNVRVNSSDVTIRQCLISDNVRTPGKVGEAVALEKNGKMLIVGNTFEDYTLGIKVSMGSDPLIDKNKFIKGSFCAILVQQQSAPTIRRNSFQEGEKLGQMCGILYLPEFSCGRIEHNTFQDFSFQPIVIFRENKVEVVHNSYVDIDYMRNALPTEELYPPKPWCMISAQHLLLKAVFKTTYDDIFPDKMLDVNRYMVVSEIGCVMMERRWPNDDISEFWKSSYETKRKKKIPSCAKHKTAPAMHESCMYCDTVYETGSEKEEESFEDSDEEDDFSSKSDDWFLDNLSKTVKRGQIPSAQMIQRKKDIEKKRKKRDAERASREKERRNRHEERTKEKTDNRLRKDTYIAVIGGAQLKECFSCGKVKFKVQHCSRCKLVYFCDTVCQKAGWPSHKVLCKIVSL